MAHKIAVLGGVGKMCSSSSVDLSKASNFDEIVLADVDIERAKELAAMLKDPRLTCRRFDAKNVDSIVDVIKGCEIVVEGLPSLFTANAREAAIRAKVKFMVSINHPTLSGELDRDSWKESDKKYRQAGIGVAMSGGQPIIESLAVMGAREMDRVDEVHIYWGMSRPFNHGSPGLVDTLLWEEDPRVDDRTYFAEGKVIVGAEPFSMIKPWEFPEQIAKDVGGEVYAQTHADPYFLPSVFPNAKIITSRGTWRKETNSFLRFLNKYGLYDLEPIEVDGVMVSPIKFIRNLWVHLCKVEEDKIRSGQRLVEDWGDCILEAEVVGIKDGIGARSVYTCIPPSHPWHEWFKKDPVGEYGVYVGLSTSTLAHMLGAGDLEMKTGLFRAAELMPDGEKFPEEFLGRLRRKGFRVYKRV